MDQYNFPHRQVRIFADGLAQGKDIRYLSSCIGDLKWGGNGSEILRQVGGVDTCRTSNIRDTLCARGRVACREQGPRALRRLLPARIDGRLQRRLQGLY